MHQRRLSYRLVLIYFFIMRKTSRVKLIPQKKKNKRSNDGIRHIPEERLRGTTIDFCHRSPSSPLLYRWLNREINQESQGVSDAANCGSVRCGPTLSKAHLLHVLLKKGYVLRASVARRNAKEIALPCCLRSFFIYRP